MLTNAVSDREINRHQFRVALFTRRGLDGDAAWSLADQLLDRDRDLDERRLCLECTGLQRSGGCFHAQQGRIHGVTGRNAQHYAPVRDLLQRCEAFQWQKP